ncbi:HIT domain protein [uncultured archaeon]|nr:HIT domain protein [uncultured archaeon]
MPLTPEQAERIKKNLIEQLEKSDQPNKEKIIEYVKGLNEAEFEEFLKQNKIQIQGEEGSETIATEPTEQKCIFCSIVNNEMPSYKIAQTKKAIAVLDINPLSKGHTMVIPTAHVPVEKLPKAALSLSQKIAKKIKKKFKPDDIKIETSSLMGHAMVNVIPLYKDVQLKKSKASEEDLKKIQIKLEAKKRASRAKPEEAKTQAEEKDELSKLPKVSFRIPR